MSFLLRSLLSIVSIAASVYAIWKIRKSQMKIEESFFWICFFMLIVCLALFPGACFWLSELLGIESPVNLVYLVMIFAVLLRTFFLEVKKSEVEYKINVLIEEVAILKNQIEQQNVGERKKNE